VGLAEAISNDARGPLADEATKKSGLGKLLKLWPSKSGK